MSELLEVTVKRLQPAVKRTALVCIYLHLGVLMVETTITAIFWNHGRVFSGVFTQTSALVISVATALGLSAGILLFVGANRKSKSLLTLFMVYMTFLLALLVVVLGSLFLTSTCIYCEVPLEEDRCDTTAQLPTTCIFFLVGALIVGFVWGCVMITITGDFYQKLFKPDECVENGILRENGLPYFNQFDEYVVPNVRNGQPSQCNETSVSPNANQYNIDPSVSNEPPPQYSETLATLNKEDDVPPTYEEAMIMNQQDI